MNYTKIGLVLCFLFSFVWGNLNAQAPTDVSVTSTVYDKNGAPVKGALVSGNGGKTTTLTDETGRFVIQLPAKTPLNISSEGYQQLTFMVGSLPARITLTSTREMQRVFVAFDTVDKRDLNGAITVLNPESFLDRDFNRTVEGGMNGRVNGLLWSNNIWGLDDAMVMIDGIRREFSDITMNEVEQITVLKGINAVALYGSQAAKGVILITTKRGQANTRISNIRVNTGVAKATALPEYLPSAEYMNLYNEARRNDGLPELFDAATIENYRNGNRYRFPDVNYYSREFLRDYQNVSDANAEFAGGNSAARFYSNIGWYHGSTLVNMGEGKKEGDTRFNVRGNVDLKLNANISSFISVSAIFNDSRRGRGNFWNNAATLLPHRVTPLIPINLIQAGARGALDLVKSSRNVIDSQYLLGGSQQFPNNPLADLHVAGHDRFVQRVFQVTNGIDFSLNNVVKGLSFHTLFNLDYANSYTQSVSNAYSVYLPTWTATGDSISGLQQIGQDNRPGNQDVSNTAQRQNIGFSAWLRYDKSIGEKHNFSSKLLGYTSAITTNNIYQPMTNSHLGLQVSYNYQHKYWADFTGTYVNSTKLPAGNRADFSPTVSLGWLLSAERFLAGAKAINHLKLTASAGILNTDLDISGFYLYNNIYARQGSFTWNDGVQATNQATTSMYGSSPNLSFPKRKEINVGVEGAFFNNLLTFQSTFFRTQMDGLLTQRFSQYPAYFNSFIPYTNYNTNQQTGFDVALNVNKNLGQFSLNLGAIATYTKSNVVKRDELFLDAYQNRAGKPVDAIFGLVSNGFFSDQSDIDKSPRQVFSSVRPGDIKYVDQNGDNVIDQRDEVMIGRWVSPLTYGLNFSAGYKNFTLFVLGTGTNGGNGLTNNSYYWVDGDKKYSTVVRNRWTEATKETATMPRLSSQQNNNNFRNSDFWLFATDRFNLSKVQLSYNLSQNVLQKSFVRELVLYVSGANLLTVAKNREILELNIASAPQMRVFNAGVRARF